MTPKFTFDFLSTVFFGCAVSISKMCLPSFGYVCAGDGPPGGDSG